MSVDKKLVGPSVAAHLPADKSAASAAKETAADPLAELTVRFEEGGVVRVEELDKRVLASSPMWATVAFLSRERDLSGALRAPRVSLRRYKKRGGRFVVDKHFTLTTGGQARALVDVLRGWFDDGGPGAVADADAGGSTDDSADD